MRFPTISDSAISFVPRLVVDDTGIAAVPSIQTGNTEAGPSTSTVKSVIRARRQVDILVLSSVIFEIYNESDDHYFAYYSS